MSTFSLIIYILAGLLTFFLAISVFLRNKKSKVNVYFFSYMLSMFFWLLSFNATFYIESQLFATLLLRASIALVALSTYLALRFIDHFPYETEEYKTILFKVFTYETALLIPITLFTPFVGSRETATSTEYGPLYIWFILHIFLIHTYLIFIAFKKHNKARGIEKLQLKYFFFGVVVAFLFGTFNNLLIPVFFSNHSYERYGVVLPLLVCLPIAYAIVKHRFLNIRVVIGELAYLGILSIIPYSVFYLVTVYETAVFGSVFTKNSLLIGVIQAPLFTILLLSASKFIKKFLNNHFIYISYNPIEWRNYFIKTTSSELRLHKLIQIFKKALMHSIQPAKVDILILGQDGDVILRSMSNDYEFALNYELLSLVSKLTKTQVITLNELQNDAYLNSNPYIKGLTKSMESMKQEVLLITQQKDSFFGIIGLGEKRDQSAYDSEDLSFLDSLATNLSVGIERSLLYLEKLNSERILKEKVKSATRTLREQKKQLEDKYQFEKDMMGILGHELRTPMTVAKGMTELVIAKGKGGSIDVNYVNEKMRKIYDSIIKESELIQTMLSTSHVDNGKLNLQIMPVNILEVIEYSYSAFQLEAKNKGLELIYEKPTQNVPIINSDPNRVQEIINNLVSNAVKYTHQGYIKIYLKVEIDKITVNVEDTGIGIPRNEIVNLGKKFYRLHQHLDKFKDVVRSGGTGLGLYVVKGVLHAMGGELKVVSTVGKGSTFSAVFPMNTKIDSNIVVINNPIDQHDMFAQLGFKNP